MATYNVYVFVHRDDEICELRNSTFSSTTNAPGTSSNPISCVQGDSIRFNFSLNGGASTGTVNVNYNGSASNYWTYTSSITVSSGSATYQLKSNAITGSGHRARVEGGGENTLVYLNIASSGPTIVAPTISSVTNNNASAANVTTTVNLSSNGSGGTLKYAQTTSNSVPASGWQTGNTFSHPRGTTRYYWASQDEDTSGAFDDSGGVSVGYIAPDTAVSPSSPTISNTATSASITITGVTSGETYQLRNQAGTVQYQSGTASSTSITITQTGGLPSAGSTLTYQVFALRPTSIGGDGAYDATGDAYTITRQAAVSYSVTAPASINEGSPGTINISTTGVSDGTVLYWSVSTGDTPVDFDSPSAGSVTISSNAASFSVTPTADATTEGAETATVTVRTGSLGGTIVATDTFTINDTSTTPVPSYAVSAPASINEGSAGTINVSTTNVSNGTTLYYTVIPSGDFATSSGNFTINSNAGSFTVTPTADSTTEGPETGTIQIRTGSTSGTIVATDTFTINDTSTTPVPTYSINAPASINEGSAGTINVTTTNVANNTTLYWDLDLNGDYSTSEGSVTITSNAGSFTITPSSDSATEGAETDTIRLYSDSGRTTEVANDSFTINDTSTGSGGTNTGNDGTSTYGLEVYGPDGSTIVFSSNFRTVAILSSESVSIAGNGGTKTYTGITDASDSTKIGVDLVSGFFANIDQAFTITRSSANGGTITVTNNNSTARTVLITITRLA